MCFAAADALDGGARAPNDRGMGTRGLLLLVVTSVACSSPSAPASDAGTDTGSAAVDAAVPVDANGPHDGGIPDGGGLVRYTEVREPCADRSALRHVYYGDMHVHTSFSMDAYVFGTRGTPADAYRYARGQSIGLTGGRTVQLARPLDFTAVTDHSENLGEVHVCTTVGGPGYDSPACVAYRGSSDFQTTIPQIIAHTCSPGGTVDCAAATVTAWDQEQTAAEAAYDRTSACQFTSLIAYEFSGGYMGSWAHRNVIFRNDHTLPTPISQRDVPGAPMLWSTLMAQCNDSGSGCEALAIPHNMNYTAGNEMALDYPAGFTMAQQRARATLRGRAEPLVEVWQNKGTSECYNNPFFGSADEFCADGDLVPAGTPLCGPDGTGRGTMNFGCVSQVDYLRGILASGMRERMRLGVNPLMVGVVGDTDTHNATPGGTPPTAFEGNHGTGDSTPMLRLMSDGPQHNTGAITGVWAVENSRDAIFEALARRETFATSGPRLAVRFFGSWGFAPSLCGDASMITTAYASGVPMGASLPARATATAPTFVVQALRDETPLQRVQIIKGWIDSAGVQHDHIYEVAGDPNNGASVDTATCTPQGTGSDSLCTVWTDPAFDPTVPAYYYVRVLENPTCHWSQYQCNAIPVSMQPPACSSTTRATTIQQRAWTSPIWYEPG
jgi:hypothetical protein